MAVSAPTLSVRPMVGFYLVLEASKVGLRSFVVGKDRSCTCGGRNCRHVRAVADYLRAGGERAPERPPSPPTPPAPTAPVTCPICGSPLSGSLPRLNEYTGEWVPVWRCLADPTHYWAWRLRGVDRNAVSRQEIEGLEAWWGRGRQELIEMYAGGPTVWS